MFIIVATYNLVHNIDTFVYTENPKFDTVTATTEVIFIILLSIVFFYELLNNPEITFIYDTKDFWIIVGFLIYTSATMFVFISIEDLTASQGDMIWKISTTANIIKNVLFGLAIYKSAATRINNNTGMV